MRCGVFVTNCNALHLSIITFLWCLTLHLKLIWPIKNFGSKVHDETITCCTQNIKGIHLHLIKLPRCDLISMVSWFSGWDFLKTWHWGTGGSTLIVCCAQSLMRSRCEKNWRTCTFFLGVLKLHLGHVMFMVIQLFACVEPKVKIREETDWCSRDVLFGLHFLLTGPTREF